MTYWKPDTCYCKLHVETKTMIEKCLAHNTYDEALEYNQSHNFKYGLKPTEEQIESIKEDRAIAAASPSNARRNG